MVRGLPVTLASNNINSFLVNPSPPSFSMVLSVEHFFLFWVFWGSASISLSLKFIFSWLVNSWKWFIFILEVKHLVRKILTWAVEDRLCLQGRAVANENGSWTKKIDLLTHVEMNSLDLPLQSHHDRTTSVWNSWMGTFHHWRQHVEWDKAIIRSDFYGFWQ